MTGIDLLTLRDENPLILSALGYTQGDWLIILRWASVVITLIIAYWLSHSVWMALGVVVLLLALLLIPLSLMPNKAADEFVTFIHATLDPGELESIQDFARGRAKFREHSFHLAMKFQQSGVFLIHRRRLSARVDWKFVSDFRWAETTGKVSLKIDFKNKDGDLGRLEMKLPRKSLCLLQEGKAYWSSSRLETTRGV